MQYMKLYEEWLIIQGETIISAWSIAVKLEELEDLEKSSNSALQEATYLSKIISNIGNK